MSGLVISYVGKEVVYTTDENFRVSVLRPASYVSHATDFSLSCIETHTTASTDPHRTDRIIDNAYMRYVLMTSYGMRKMRTPLTAIRKLLKTNPPLTSVTGDHQGVQCVNRLKRHLAIAKTIILIQDSFKTYSRPIILERLLLIIMGPYRGLKPVDVHRPASYASHATDFSLPCIETHTTAYTDPHRTDRIIGTAYMRYVLVTIKASAHRSALYATDFSLYCIETHTTASTDPHRTHSEFLYKTN
uniref:SFRICE_001057 n=1 Tax=Spodoptera frugiperda TaxID=7108 RepID=A0A2H1VHW0_SPOFR